MARLYGYSPQTIADMTPYQQWLMLQDDEHDPTVELLSFRDMAEYNAWLARKNSGQK